MTIYHGISTAVCETNYFHYAFAKTTADTMHRE
jgi:hypothetical protein